MLQPTILSNANFTKRIIFLGFGSIVVASLPLFLKHICSNPKQYHIIAKESPHWTVADEYGISYEKREILKDNYEKILGSSNLGKGDILINLTLEVNSVDLMLYCNKVGALYLDTCIEPWVGTYTDPSVSNSHKSNYAIRENALSVKSKLAGGPTAIIAHGANPGLVNHFVKRALCEMAKEEYPKDFTIPKNKQEWAKLAQQLGVKAIQISERDTQQPTKPKQRDEVVNTWSVDGFISEGIFQPAELGWGTHEKEMPYRGEKHDFGCQSAIYIDQPGASIKVRGWTPNEGPYHGFLVTHNESVGIADYFTLKDKNNAVYRPTVYYCYHPADCAVASVHEILGNNSVPQRSHRLIMDEITIGSDELGVLLLGDFHGYTGYWHGSNLSIEQTRDLVPHNNATSLQVAAGVLAAITWALENPNEGLTEPDDIDHQYILNIADQYLGEIISAKTSWTPIAKRNAIIKEDYDTTDPWQFKNFRVKF